MKTIRISTLILGMAAAWVATREAGAQQLGGEVPAGNVLYTVGTTFRSNGADYVYLLWNPTDDNLLRQRAYSVWSKPGGPNSPAAYQPVSWIKVQTDPNVIELALLSAQRLGQDLSKLEVAIDGLFADIRPAAGVSRAEKLSVILQGARNDSEMFRNLLVLARFHPAVSLCMGAAYAGPIDGLRTYEVRMAGVNDGPHAPEAARRVVGRITLDPAAYEALPAPGAPVSVPFGSWDGGVFYPDARSNLTARMRWATPDALRQKALLQFGYRVYRISPAFYQSQIVGGSLNPGDLAAYATAFPNEVKQANRLPVLIERMLNQAEAADRLADPDTAFFVDSNDLGEPGALPLSDGQKFRYLVTAVDILGRDGHASTGTEITIYRTTPPNAPRGVTVEDHVTHPTSTTTRQEFRITWREPAAVNGIPIARYDVYRWAKAEDINKAEPETAPVKVATVAAVPGAEWHEAKDASLGVPVPANQLGKVWWFTVRAVSAGALADLGPLPGAPVSPHSGPASGVLRDRSTPPVPVDVSAVVRIVESGPQLGVNPTTTEEMAAPDYGYLNARITLPRGAAALDGADYYYRINDTAAAGDTKPTPMGPAPLDAGYLGSVRFTDGGPDELVTVMRLPLPTNSGTHTVTLHVRGRDKHGNLTPFASKTLTVGDATYHLRHLVPLVPSHSYAMAVAGTGPTLLRHVSRRADNGQVNFPQIELENIPGGHVCKILRRIDQGELELEVEGEAPGGGGQGGEWQINTRALAVSAGEVAYYLQLTNPAGVAGAMKEIGRFLMSPLEPPPRPMLLPVEALPAAQATLSWACAPHGVERFHVGVAAIGRSPSDTISGQLSTAFANRSAEVEVDGQLTALDFRMYDTGALGDKLPERSVTLTLEEGVTYHFLVQAVSSTGEQGAFSNPVSFAWVSTVDGGPNAPWPARTPAQINSAFGNPRASMSGILIGTLPKNTVVTKDGDTWLLRPPAGSSPVDLMTRLFRESSGPVEGARRDRYLLPCVVYRYQVPNSKFPVVSGEVVQVSPLIKGIAAQVENSSGVDYTVVYDPYIRFITNNNHIYLMPPHPLINQASYRYLMVLFREDGEIDSVVPTTTFQVETNPN
jgi:hypothetical protein